MPRISRSNQLRKLADNLERVADKRRKDGWPLPLDARCTLFSIAHYCKIREKLWKAAIK
jgi:hypothetical protein